MAYKEINKSLYILNNFDNDGKPIKTEQTIELSLHLQKISERVDSTITHITNYVKTTHDENEKIFHEQHISNFFHINSALLNYRTRLSVFGLNNKLKESIKKILDELLYILQNTNKLGMNIRRRVRRSNKSRLAKKSRKGEISRKK